jgi:hypothetical protein
VQLCALVPWWQKRIYMGSKGHNLNKQVLGVTLCLGALVAKKNI